jgi:GLPGLI family protein
MKPALFFTVFLMSSSLLAQKKEGVVIYERKQNMHRTVGEEMRAMIPEFNISKQMLLFTHQQSLYKAVPEEEAPDPFNNKSGGAIMLGSRSSETYMHFGENRKLTATEIFGDAFLITDTIKKLNWIMGDESKTIAGYLCKKATTTTKNIRPSVRMFAAEKSTDKVNVPSPKLEDIEVVAWYAVDLQSSAGPENYLGLPGVVLEVDIDKSTTVFSAQEVLPLSDMSQLKAPKKGRKVTPEEYNKEMKKMIENMGSGPIQIRTGL